MINNGSREACDTGLRTVSIFDTTLRDGEQAPGNAMSADQKVAVGLELERLGVDVIEAGFPASSPSDFDAAERLSESVSSATIATFARALRGDISTAVDAVGVDNHQVQLLTTASELHLVHKRGITRREAWSEAAAATRFARELGVTDISLGLEDASRGDPELLKGLIESGLAEGATTVAVADTSGCLTPQETSDLIASVCSWVPDDVTVSVHCHDDMGLAVANSLAAIEAGVDQVQTTLAGIGERAGNTALEELVAVLAYRGDKIAARTDIRAERLFGAFQVLDEAISVDVARNKSILGANAFATQAGIHQQGMLRKPETYEYLDPDQFGRERTMLVGRHSGRAILRHLVKGLESDIDDALVDELYQEFIAGRTDRECVELDVLRDRLLERAGAAVGAV